METVPNVSTMAKARDSVIECLNIAANLRRYAFDGNGTPLVITDHNYNHYKRAAAEWVSEAVRARRVAARHQYKLP